MRRPAAILIAVALTLPLSVRVASPVAPTTSPKLSSAMRVLVANKGYRNPAAVSKLVRGSKRGDVYYFAQVRGRLDRALMRSLNRAGARVRVALPEISTVALVSRVDAIARVANIARVRRLEADRVEKLLGANVEYVSAAALQKWGDQKKRGTFDVGAETMWKAGIDGSGVTIGVTDSGVDSTHPDLDNLDWLNWGGAHPSKVGFVDCQASLPNLLVAQGDSLPAMPEICLNLPGYDDNGHGTHVSGIATGTAQGSGAQAGLYPGMAPGSLLRVAKVCAAAGTCLLSNVMAGMRYLALEKSEGGAGADIINMSLGSGRFYFAPLFGAELVTNNDLQSQLVNALSEIHNALFVISAGNSGPSLGSLGSPAVASQSLAVAAGVADFDLDHPEEQTLHGEFGNIQPNATKNNAIGIAAFSSRGPSGDRLVKPDVVAPGVYVVAPEALLGAEVAAGDFGHQHSFSSDRTYAVLSGTSMSAPSAAGVAALVASGYKRSFGDIPAYWRLKAALANTAGTKAMEGSVAGLLFGTLVANGIGELEDHYPVRNTGLVGITGTGAGRVNGPAALLALTQGVIAYTPQSGTLDDIHELQPSWAMDDLAPGGSARGTFLFEGAKKMPGSATVTFKVITESEPAGMFKAGSNWFTVPSSLAVSKGRATPASFGLRVPSNAKPGAYTAMILATVKIGSLKQTIRIPVQFFVRMTEPNAGVGGSSIEGPIWAEGTTDYTIVGFENPLGDILTDWTMIPLYIPKGVTRVDFSVYDTAEKDQMDIFIFNNEGQEVDSTIATYPTNWAPGGLLYAPSTKEFPSKLTIIGESVDGTDPADYLELTLPTTVWIAISDSGPANAPSMTNFHLDYDMVGAASTGINGVAAPAPRPKPAAAPQDRPLPATGVGGPQGIVVLLLAGAAALATWMRPRRLGGP